MWWEPETLDNFNSLRPGTIQCRYVNLTCYSIPTRCIFKLLPILTLEENSKLCLQFPNLPQRTIITTYFRYFDKIWFLCSENQLLEDTSALIPTDRNSARWLPGFLPLPERGPMWEIETIETLPANLHTRLTSHIIIMSRTLFTRPFNEGGKLWWLFSSSPSPEIYILSFDVSFYDGSMVALQQYDIIFMSRIEYSHTTLYCHSSPSLFSDDCPDILIRNNDFPSQRIRIIMRSDNTLTVG